MLRSRNRQALAEAASSARTCRCCFCLPWRLAGVCRFQCHSFSRALLDSVTRCWQSPCLATGGGFGLRRDAGPWIAALAALGFAFSGLAIAIARYPHFETLIAAFFLLFAVARVLGHPRLAVAFFVLGLAAREDAGFHYVAILGLLVTLNVAYGVPLRQQRTELTFALAALFYAIAVMAMQRLVFPETSAFARVYLGDPPLAHLSAGLIADRILSFLVGRPYILYPSLGACIWALRARSPYVVLAFAAGIPWVLVHLLAKVRSPACS